MISFQTTASEYNDAGCMHEAIALHSFIDETTFFTKNGQLGVVLAFPGIDFEGQDPVHLDYIARRFEAAARSFSEKHRLYQYLIKTSAPPIEHGSYDNEVVSQAMRNRVAHFTRKAESLYTVDVFLVLTAQVWTAATGLANTLSELRTNPRKAIQSLFSANCATTVLQSDLESSRAELANIVQSFITAADVFAPSILGKADAYRFFRRLLNYDPNKHLHSQLPNEDGDLLDYYVCDSFLETHRGYMKQDDYYIHVLTLKQPPSGTFANTFAELIKLPTNAIICTEFRRLPNGEVLKELHNKQRHFHNTRSSFLGSAMAGENPQAGQVLVNAANTALVDDLGDCLQELEVRNNYFGEFSFTLILYNRDRTALLAAVAEAHKTFSTKDALLLQETYNIFNAYLAVIPGNNLYNLRRMFITAVNYADLSFLFTVSAGF